MADYGIQLGKLFFVGLLSVILMIDIVVGLQALYYWQLDRVETSEDIHQPPAKLEVLLAAQQTRLTDYSIVDAKKEIVAIPIDRAMKLVVAELSRGGRTTAASTGEPR
jgi:ATP/ADP translocase